MSRIFIVKIGGAVFGLSDDSPIIASIPELLRDSVALKMSYKTEFYWRSVDNSERSMAMEEIEDLPEEEEPTSSSLLSDPPTPPPPPVQLSQTAEELLDN